jgi:hypothetical protein
MGLPPAQVDVSVSVPEVCASGVFFFMWINKG